MSNTNKALMDFLIAQHGGKEKVESDYRKSTIREAFKERLSRDVSMREVSELARSKGWAAWLEDLSVVEFLNIFSKNTPPVSVATAMAMERKHALQILETSRNSVPDNTAGKNHIDKIMLEFNTTPWLTKDDLKRVTGLLSTVSIDRLTCVMRQRKLIKRCRGRKIAFARYDEITPPPFYL